MLGRAKRGPGLPTRPRPRTSRSRRQPASKKLDGSGVGGAGLAGKIWLLVGLEGWPRGQSSTAVGGGEGRVGRRGWRGSAAGRARWWLAVRWVICGAVGEEDVKTEEGIWPFEANARRRESSSMGRRLRFRPGFLEQLVRAWSLVTNSGSGSGEWLPPPRATCAHRPAVPQAGRTAHEHQHAHMHGRTSHGTLL